MRLLLDSCWSALLIKNAWMLRTSETAGKTEFPLETRAKCPPLKLINHKNAYLARVAGRSKAALVAGKGCGGMQPLRPRPDYLSSIEAMRLELFIK